MISIPYSDGQVNSSSLIHSVSEAVSSPMRIEFDIGQSNAAMLVPTDVVESDASRLVEQPSEPKVWKAEYHQRFQKLSRKEACEEITIAEEVELEELTRLRRAKKYPRTADEILWERKQRAVTRMLVESLNQYVQFHETPRPA